MGFSGKFSRTFITAVAMTMAVLLSNIPATLMAQEMISTSVVVEQMARTQADAAAQAKVAGFLQSQDVRSELAKRGLSSDEISSRLASLSASELRALSGQIDEARAGGNILYAILIVVLIIFLIQRI